MSQEEYDLTVELSHYGDVNVCKAGRSFTLFVTGHELDNMTKVSHITEKIIKKFGDIYPFVEVVKNQADYLLLVLVTKQIKTPASELKKAVREKLEKFTSMIGHPDYNTRIEQNAVETLIREFKYLDSIVEFEDNHQNK